MLTYYYRSSPRPEEYIFYKGKKFQIEFFFTEQGTIPVRKLLESLTSKRILIKLAAFVKLMGDQGILYDEQKFRIVDKKEKIYEFKPAGYRFFNFFHTGRKIIITNGYAKKFQKVDKKELKRAIESKKDYIRRTSGGEYYGK